MAEQCKEQMFKDWHFHQCSRKAVKDGYCKQHHPDSVKARADAAQAKWDARWAKVDKKKRIAAADAGLFDAVDALFFAQIAKGMITLETETHPDESLNPIWQAYLKRIEEADNA